MKRSILFSGLLIPVLSWAQSGAFTLSGAAGANTSNKKIYLAYANLGKRVIDSGLIMNDRFSFKGALAEPVTAQLLVDHDGKGLAGITPKSDILTFYLENADIHIMAKDSVKNAIISGSTLNDEDKKFKAAVSMAGKAEKRTIYLEYIRQHPASYVSLAALIELAGAIIDVPLIKPLYDSLSGNVRNSYRGTQFGKLIDAINATAIGAMAPLFTQNDVDGKPVSLGDLRGKYVLLDFWASWCGPCRQENPHLVKTYHQYKDKNFTVLGVSLDQPGKKDAWLAAIKADGLEWSQVSDLKYWDNAAAKQYGVRAIPQNYLIDPGGKIIGKNLRGEELDQKLADLLK